VSTDVTVFIIKYFLSNNCYHIVPLVSYHAKHLKRKGVELLNVALNMAICIISFRTKNSSNFKLSSNRHYMLIMYCFVF
jgi:hypothetical protein